MENRNPELAVEPLQNLIDRFNLISEKIGGPAPKFTWWKGLYYTLNDQCNSLCREIRDLIRWAPTCLPRSAWKYEVLRGAVTHLQNAVLIYISETECRRFYRNPQKNVAKQFAACNKLLEIILLDHHQPRKNHKRHISH